MRSNVNRDDKVPEEEGWDDCGLEKCKGAQATFMRTRVHCQVGEDGRQGRDFLVVTTGS